MSDPIRNEIDRAFKEWAVVCDALKSGRQTVLVRKGGIREEDGIFRVEESQFLLLPTYEHQNAALLQPQFAAEVTLVPPFDARQIVVDAFAVVDTVSTAEDEEAVKRLTGEYVWNEEYVKQRFDFNPYDPVYVMLLRVYALPAPVTLPMRAEYGGCRSWITLEQTISTTGAAPVIDDEQFDRRRQAVLGVLVRGD